MEGDEEIRDVQGTFSAHFHFDPNRVWRINNFPLCSNFVGYFPGGHFPSFDVLIFSTQRRGRRRSSQLHHCDVFGFDLSNGYCHSLSRLRTLPCQFFSSFSRRYSPAFPSPSALCPRAFHSTLV